MKVLQTVLPVDVAQLALQNVSPPDNQLALDSTYIGVSNILKHSKIKDEVALWEKK